MDHAQLEAIRVTIKDEIDRFLEGSEQQAANS